VRWPNPESARFVADIDAASDGVARYTYRCERCDGWHVTKLEQGDAADRGR